SSHQNHMILAVFALQVADVAHKELAFAMKLFPPGILCGSEGQTKTKGHCKPKLQTADITLSYATRGRPHAQAADSNDGGADGEHIWEFVHNPEMIGLKHNVCTGKCPEEH